MEHDVTLQSNSLNFNKMVKFEDLLEDISMLTAICPKRLLGPKSPLDPMNPLVPISPLTSFIYQGRYYLSDLLVQSDSKNKRNRKTKNYRLS